MRLSSHRLHRVHRLYWLHRAEWSTEEPVGTADRAWLTGAVLTMLPLPGICAISARPFEGPLIRSEGCTTELNEWFLAERVQPAPNLLQFWVSDSFPRTTAPSL